MCHLIQSEALLLGHPVCYQLPVEFRSIECSKIHHSLGATALHSLELGFRTVLIDDCSRGIEVGAINKTKDSIREGHGVVADSSEVRKRYVTFVLARGEKGSSGFCVFVKKA